MISNNYSESLQRKESVMLQNKASHIKKTNINHLIFPHKTFFHIKNKLYHFNMTEYNLFITFLNLMLKFKIKILYKYIQTNSFLSF